MLTVIFLILISIGIGVLFYKLRPETAKRLFRWYKGSKEAVLAGIGILTALIFISSGTLTGTLVGGVAFVLLSWYILIDEPQEALR